MFTRTASSFWGVLVLLPMLPNFVQAEETRGQAIAKTLLEAYSRQQVAQQRPQALPYAADSSQSQALALAHSILNNLPAGATSSQVAAAPSHELPAHNMPAAAFEELNKLQDVLETIRQGEPAKKLATTPPSSPIINTRELIRVFDNLLWQRNLKAASESYPDNPVVWFLRAYQEQQLGHQTESAAALERALSTVPEGLIAEPIRAQLKEGIPASD